MDIAPGKVKCLLCAALFARKAARMLSHLGYRNASGNRDTGVGICKRLTPQIKGLFLNCRGDPPKRPNPDLSDECRTPRAGNMDMMELCTPQSLDRESRDGPQEIPNQRSGSNTNETTASRPPSTERDSAAGRAARPLRQAGIPEGFQEDKRRELDKMWARFFYEANIPFAIARNSTFKEAVRRTSAFRGPYTPPSYNDLRKKLLMQAKNELGVVLEGKMADSIRKFGATLTFDGWSSCTNQPLFNCMIVSAVGEHFLGSVDTSGHSKTATYQATIIEKFIEGVGSQNVVQIATDNASVMKAAADLVTNKYDHIYFQGCAVHAMNLLLGDIAKANWIAHVLKKARTIVTFIKKRHMPLAVFRKHEKKFSLVLAGKTRFGSNFMMVDRLLEVRQALEQSVVDEQWTSYVVTLRDKRGGIKARTISRDVRRYILDDHFWQRCTNFQEVVAPLMYALRDFDSGEPGMGKIRHIFHNVEKHIERVKDEFFPLDGGESIDVEKHFRDRWALVRTDLHDAGALLNPYLLHDKELADDLDAITACKRVLGKLCSPETYPDVVLEFLAFRHKEPPFHNMLDPKQQKCSPHAWWDFEGACGKLIAPIARRILAQTVSSSSCERNWSSYSFVHNRSRNRLQQKRAEDLVYVYTNSKLLAKAKRKDQKKWYDENVSSEDSDSASEESDGDDEGDWVGNHASDDDRWADVPLDDWSDQLSPRRPDSSPARSGRSSHDVYEFAEDGEEGNHVQASNADDTGVNVREEDNSIPALGEEEGDKRGEDGGTRIDTVHEGVLKDPKDSELELSPGRKATMVNNGHSKWKGIEEDFGPISKSPLKFGERDSPRGPRLEDQMQRTALASRALFDNSKTPTPRVPLASSTGLVSLSKAVNKRVRESDGDSESDGNLPLSVAIIKKPSGVPPRHNQRPMQKMTVKETLVGPKHISSSGEKFGATGNGSAKRKRLMQPFAASPPKPGRVKTPLDASGSTWKMKSIQPVKKERKENEYYSHSDDESYDAEDSSGAEVKGDSDYKAD